MNRKQIEVIDLPKLEDPRGNLSFIESCNHIPFNIKRAFWIYDVPGGEFRGSHAYKESEEFIIALSGSLSVHLDDGHQGEKTFELNRSYYGLYVPNLVWRSLSNFSTNSLCLILSSTIYNEDDYIHEYSQFMALVDV